MKFKINNYKNLAHYDNKELLENAMAKGVINLFNASPAMITTPNLNTPIEGYLAYVKPKHVQILTAIRAADKIAQPERNGTWKDEIVEILTKEYVGKVSSHNETVNGVVFSSVNNSFEIRGNYKFDTAFQIGLKEEMTAGAFKTSASDDKMNACMEALAIERNKIFFNGKAEKGLKEPVEGLLNAKGSPDYISVNAGTKGSTFFDDKTGEEIYKDINNAIQFVYTQSNGNAIDSVESGKKIKLIISLNKLQYLNTYNTLGNRTAIEMLQATYNNKIEVIPAPQLIGANNGFDVFYIVIDGNQASTLINSYSEMALFSPLYVNKFIKEQQMTASMSGAILQLPIMEGRFTNI